MQWLIEHLHSIKLYAWEYAFVRKISFVRNQEELKMLKKIGIVTVRNLSGKKLSDDNTILQSLNSTMWSGIPCTCQCSSSIYSLKFLFPTVLVAFSSFATAAAVSSRPLTSDVIFPAISLFMLLQFPLGMVCLSKLRKTSFLDIDLRRIYSSAKSHLALLRL